MKYKILIPIGILFFVSLVNAQLLYNTTNLTNSDNLYKQAVAVNDITGGGVGLGLVAMFTIIPFLIVTTKLIV